MSHGHVKEGYSKWRNRGKENVEDKNEEEQEEVEGRSGAGERERTVTLRTR